jgi:hypothetical protein
MKAYVGDDVLIHIFLISTVDGGESPVSRPCSFTHGEIAPGAHWIGWVGPRSGMYCVEKSRILPLPRIELRPSSPQPVAIPTLLSRLKRTNGYIVIKF